jgi:glycine betaine/proline transport system substrate-binding protein
MTETGEGTYKVAHVKLPPRFKGCLDNEKLGGDPKKYACEYPPYPLDKLVSGEFATSGSPALRVIKRFKWAAADQNFVASLIGVKHMKPDKAALAWVKAHPAEIKAWLGK